MSKIAEVLKNESKVIGFCFFVNLVFFLIFRFTNLNISYFYLGFEISIFVLLIYLAISYFFLKAKINLRDENARLKNINKELVNEKIQLKNNILEYFLLWIHQIKTPITSAKLLVQKDEIDREILNKQLFYIEDYTNMALTYLKVLNTEADLDICEVDLDSIIRQVLRKYSIIFISNKVKLNYKPIEKYVISDSKYLTIIIEQIISNSAKYAKNKSVSIYFKDDSLVIEDTGIGILPEDIPKIFDKGYCGFNGRMNQKSSGIGLFLVREISKRLSIDVRVESKVNEYTAFYLKFNN